MKQSILLNFVILAFLITLFSCNENVDTAADNNKTTSNSQVHPNLIITAQGVKNIRAQLGNIPIFDETLKKVKEEIDAEIESGIETPLPKDYSGGYTHTRHKRNWFVLQKAGVLYQILDDEKYAQYVKDILFQYEAMYKSLPLHPKTRSYKYNHRLDLHRPTN